MIFDAWETLKLHMMVYLARGGLRASTQGRLDDLDRAVTWEKFVNPELIEWFRDMPHFTDSKMTLPFCSKHTCLKPTLSFFFGFGGIYRLIRASFKEQSNLNEVLWVENVPFEIVILRDKQSQMKK